MAKTLGSVLEPTADARADDPSPQHPFRSALMVTFIGYVVLAALMLGIGFLLTHALDGTVGSWDRHVSEHFARHRTSGWNDITKVATAAVNTLPVVVVAAVVVGLLALRRRWREAAFLTIALFLEITVFLSVTFVVDRPRPDVPRLNSTPATSSFPSGHTGGRDRPVRGHCRDRRVPHDQHPGSGPERAPRGRLRGNRRVLARLPRSPLSERRLRRRAVRDSRASRSPRLPSAPRAFERPAGGASAAPGDEEPPPLRRTA